MHTHTHTHTHTHPFNGPWSGTTRVSRYQKGKSSLDFTEARDSEWQRHQLGHMQVCTSLQTDNHTSTPPLSSLQAGCPSCRPANSVKALKANTGAISCNLFAAAVARCCVRLTTSSLRASSTHRHRLSPPSHVRPSVSHMIPTRRSISSLSCPSISCTASPT